MDPLTQMASFVRGRGRQELTQLFDRQLRDKQWDATLETEDLAYSERNPRDPARRGRARRLERAAGTYDEHGDLLSAAARADSDAVAALSAQ